MRYAAAVAALGLLLAACGTAGGTSVTFTAAQIKSVMASQGAPLSDASYQWGLWAVRARPVISGGSFTITGASTTQAGWGTDAPSWYGWSTYGTNCAWFWDDGGAEVAGNASNPLYMIRDVSDANMYSGAFNKNGAFVATSAPGTDGLWGTGDDLGTFYASGYDEGAGGTNKITAVSDASTFTFDFTVDSGTWNGQWEFLVDGTKDTLGTASDPGSWVENFWGDYGAGGGLAGNTGDGYLVPEPATLALMGLGGVFALIRRHRK